MKLLGRIAWAIVAAGATGIAFWVGAKPDSSFWRSHSWLLYAAGVVLAVNVLLPAVARAWLEAFPPSAMPRNRQVQQAVNSGFLVLWRRTQEDSKERGFRPIEIQHLGLHAYRIRPRLCRGAILERIADLRFSIPPPTRMSWTKGKGVIGICWQKEKWVIVDTTKAYKQAETIPARDWRKADQLITMGLTREELERTKDYGVIAAQPMFDYKDPRNIVGCLAITAPAGSDAQFDTDYVKELLAQLSNTVWSAWNSP